MKIPTALLAALLAFGLAAPSGAADLIDVYRAAQSGDAVFAAARAAQQAGQEKSRQGIALLLPTISARANSQFNDITTDTGSLFVSGGNKQYNSHGYGFTLVQPLFRQQNWA
ncbi:MAG: channel protein TolC, partial [Gallionellaceae bacterium CG_4_10_14_3_um_filter_60_1069]